MISLDRNRFIEQVNQLGYSISGLNDLMKIGPRNKVVKPVLLEHLHTITDEPDKQTLEHS